MEWRLEGGGGRKHGRAEMLSFCLCVCVFSTERKRQKGDNNGRHHPCSLALHLPVLKGHAPCDPFQPLQPIFGVGIYEEDNIIFWHRVVTGVIL